MACLNSRNGGCGCRMAARNMYASPASAGMNYAASREQTCTFPYYCGPCGPTEPVNTCTAHCPPGSAPSCPCCCNGGTAAPQSSCCHQSATAAAEGRSRCCCEEETDCRCREGTAEAAEGGNQCCCRAETAYGSFTHSTVMSVAAGGILPFEDTPSASVNITQNGGLFTLPKAGVYLAILSMNPPACGCPVNSVLSMRMNGSVVPGGTIAVDSASSGEHLSASALMTAAAGSTFSVHSSGSFSLTPDQNRCPIASLTLVRID